MKVSIPARIVVFCALSSLMACGVSTAHRPLAPAKKNDQNQASGTVKSELPTFMIAKSAASDADSGENAAVEFRIVKSATSLSTAESVAEAFKSGAPAPVAGESSLSLNSPGGKGYTMGMPAQAPVQMGDPCDPCARSKGQVYTTSTGTTRGYFPRVAGFLRKLNPFARYNGGNVPYGYTNQYTYGGDNYTVYQQGMPFQQVQYQNSAPPQGNQNQEPLPR